jgi:colanic acid biosynthesis glycosyl transferase WcaI
MVAVPHYRPDGGPSAPLFTSLCEELARRGHQVTVLTAVPHYPSGQVPKEYRGKLRMQADENGVRVIRVALPSLNRRDFARRVIQFIAYQVGATLAGWNQDYDVYLTVTAALQVWLPFVVLSVLRHKPTVYSIHDVYPDVGVKMGLFRHKAVIRLVAGMEDYCLKHATRIRILSESFAPSLLARGVPASKLELIHDWVDTALFRPLPRDNGFAVEHDLTDRFVVLYAGNIGYLQGLDHILEAASLLRECDDIRLVFVGDGAARDALVAMSARLDLPNVNFLPYQPIEQMPEILATADVSLVSLVKGAGLGALPSKSYGILASGRPLLASIDEGSEGWNLVERAEAGICVPPEDPSRLSEAILTLKRDDGLRAQLGQNGRIWVERHHSPRSAAEQFEKLLEAAVASQRHAEQAER